MAGDEWLISRAAPDGGRLRLRFARQGDRLHQTVEWLAAAATSGASTSGASTSEASTSATSPVVVLLESCEGQSSDTWPASPPLQQLLIEPRGAAGHVALLVGMAGRSHWSLSIEPLVDRVGFRFDAACRLSGPPEWLGHVWRAAAAARERPVATGCLRIVAEEGAECQIPPTLAPDARPPEPLATESRVPEATPLEAVAEYRVRAVDASSVAARGRFPATVQWRFVLEWAPLPQ